MDVNNQVLNRQRLNNQGLQLGGGTTNPEDPNKTVFNSLLDIYPDNIINQSSVVTGYKKGETIISFPYSVDKIEPISGSRYTATQLGLTPIEQIQKEGETRIVLDPSVTEAWFGKTATMGKRISSTTLLPENKNENLKTVKFVDGITELVDYVFTGCDALQYVEIPKETTTIGVEAFSSCSNLKSIEIPNKVTIIGKNAFHSCWNLELTKIPESVKNIESGAFHYCRKVTSLKIPKEVTEIKSWTFARTGLTTIELHESITKLGYRAFFDCSSLSSLKIPSSVTYIDELVFEGCSKLTTINYNSTQAN